MPPTTPTSMTPATPRLYHDDPLLLRFSARVIAHGTLGGRASVVLDRTAFYPEAGGQMADRGTLGGAAVADVQADEAGVVHHLLAGGIPAGLPVGAEVEGAIDEARRRLHMALHTGQHVLSRALLDVAGAETVSSRLGESGCTIDLRVADPRGAALDEAMVLEAVELANRVVERDLPVRAFFPSPEELSRLSLRREPKVEENVRVIVVGDFDASPCGGTHCLRTSQIGPIGYFGLERTKGLHRVHFEAGSRARRLLQSHSDAARATGRMLACPPTELPQSVERLRAETKAAREEARALKERLAAHLARELEARAAAVPSVGVPFIEVPLVEVPMVEVIDDADLELLRAVARRLIERPGAVVLLAGRAAGGMEVIAARASDAAFDCGGFLRRLAAEAGGRGGGRPNHAEGRLPASTELRALAERIARDAK